MVITLGADTLCFRGFKTALPVEIRRSISKDVAGDLQRIREVEKMSRRLCSNYDVERKSEDGLSASEPATHEEVRN